MRCLFAVLLAAVPVVAADPIPKPPTSLVDYVGKKDPAFGWKLTGKVASPAGVVYDLALTSQKWQDITWEHGLQVYVPTGAKPQKTMVLWNQGGKPNEKSGAMGLLIAQTVGAPVAFLYGVPNQPLYGGKTEDALIAHTFVKYLETKDESWPLLFPMVKSVTAAMDALQAFAKKELDTDVAAFVVTGASKRGWTSWLTAASGDKRVKAIAPLVIDTLNMPAQMKNQVAAFGKPSDMIADYTRAGLVPIPDTPEAKKLWQMIDPFVYRESLTLPKMLINGTNDPYWPQDALNSYWDELKGPKAVCYVPNAGHGLTEMDEKGKPELVPMRAINTLSAFAAAQIFDEKLPELKWTWDGKAHAVTAVPSEKGKVSAVRAWTADADTRDFRKSRWKSETVKGGSECVVTPVVPEKGFRASMVEVEFQTGHGALHLCTQIRILEAKK